MESNNSLMIVLEEEEYCFLYDRPSFPDVLENLLDVGMPPGDSSVGGLDFEQAREITRGLLGQAHQDL